MQSILPRTRREVAAAAALALLLLFGAPALWALLTPSPEPIAVTGSEVAWEPGERALRVHSGARAYTTSCPTILLARWLELRDGPPLYVAAEPLSGPLFGRGILPPRREASIEGPATAGPSELRLLLPDWVHADQVLSVVVRISVPTNRPCANGYSGSYDLYRLAVP